MAILGARFAGAQPGSSAADSFEVASIRAADANQARPTFEFTPGGGLRAVSVTLRLLIEAAYRIRSEQLSGGPGWADSLLFTIDAKAPSGASSHSDAVLRRLRALLAERFQLSLRRNPKAASGYALVVAKGGHKMTESTLPQMLRQRGMAEVRAQGVGMDILTRWLAVRMQNEVVDRTELTARFDFTLRCELLRPPADAPPGGVPGWTPGPSSPPSKSNSACGW
jgi:uncharacterized protein (TIGR03435 family)